MKYLFLFCIPFLSIAAMHPDVSSKVTFFLYAPNTLAEKYFNFSSIEVDRSELSNSFDLALGVKIQDSFDSAKCAFEEYQLFPVEALALKVACKAFERYSTIPAWDFITETEINFFGVLGRPDHQRVYQLVSEQKERILGLIAKAGGGRSCDEFADMVSVVAHSCNLY